jgi:hypothetical protein
MKKGFNIALYAIMVLMLLAGCAGAPKQQADDTPASKTAAAPSGGVPQLLFDYDIVDYQGAAGGRPVPRWADLVMSKEKGEIKKLPDFSGMEVYVADIEGADLDLLRASAQIQAYGEISGQIKTAISGDASRHLSGNAEDVKTKQQFIDSTLGTATQSVVTGFVRDRDFWQKIQYRKDSPKAGQQAIKYYPLYIIGTEDLRLQLDLALGKVEVKTQAEREAKDAMLTAVKEAKSLLAE